MRNDTAARYILEEFERADRLAVVLVNKQTESVIQRIASAGQIASAEFQDWLGEQNRKGYEVYCSPNVLHEDARGRTKAEVATIKHVYLDFDEDGTAALERMRERTDLPEPNRLINSSPDRWQAMWRVKDFSKEQAEELQRGLARELGADPAATDCSRVMRVPGFYNHKYQRPYYVRLERLTEAIHTRERFPKLEPEDRGQPRTAAAPPRENGQRSTGHLTQSERDWAYARRALARGEAPEAVIAAIAQFRQGDKRDAYYYAERTVHKAVQSLHGPESATPDR